MSNEPPAPDDWVRLISVASGLEADIKVAFLEAAEIEAVSRGNDFVGFLGPGFAGPTARGTDIFVRFSDYERAREIVDEEVEEEPEA